jgi:hypothetical protein
VVALGGAGVGVGESKSGSFVTLRGLNWQETILDDGIDSAWIQLKNFAPQRLCRPRIAFPKRRLYSGTRCNRIGPYTNSWTAYKGAADSDTEHEMVNHREEEWVRGDVHTNSVENVWSLLKRGVVETYHKLSVKHLDAYLDELEHRFNNRSNKFLFRDTLLKLVKAEKLPYAELTKAA